MEFKDRLKQIRKMRGYTQKELAKLCGTSERVIQNYELGERKPGFDAIISLCNALDISSDFLLGLQ